MEQSPSRQANSRSASQEIPPLYRTLRFNTLFTTARRWSLSCARWIESTPSHPVSSIFHCLGRSKERVQFRNPVKRFTEMFFYGEKLLTPRSTP